MTINCERLLELRYLHMEPSTEACVNCVHFRMHYCKDGYPLYSGHCGYPRLKCRKVHDICKHFQSAYTAKE